MKKSITILVLVLVFRGLASGQVCNVPITLTNSQNTATSDSFEQMITVNSSLFSSVEKSDLDNIEFTVGSPAPTGTILQAWIESGNSSSSDTTVYWVNLADSIIPANGTLKIYMNFMPSSVLSMNGPTGVAPDISSTYAQYDNGGLVFPHVYTRWGGLSGGDLPSAVNGDAINGGDITSISTPTYGSLSVTNSATYTQLNFNGTLYNYTYNYPQCIYGAYYSTTPSSSYTYPTVLESKVDIGSTYSWFGTGYGQEEEGWGALIANDNNNSGNPTYSVRSNWNLQSPTNCGAGVSSYADYTSLSESNPVVNVWSILLNNVNDTDQITNVMYNYTQIPGQTFPITPIDGSGATVYQAPCSGGLGTLFGYFGTFQNTPNTQPYEQVYWTRTRVFPPNGIMPAANVDTLAGIGLLTLVVPIDTICKGASVTLTALGGSSYTWSNSDTGSVITVMPTSTSVFIVTATTGCGSASDTVTITVDTASQVLTILPPAPAICNGQNITLFVSGSGFSFAWSPAGSLNDSTGDTVLATPVVTTTYTVTGSDSLGCSATGTDVVMVQKPPNKPTITLSVTGDTLFSSARNGNQWFINGQSVSGATDSIFVITGYPPDTFKVEVTDVANGCSSISDSLVTTGIEQLSVTGNRLSVYPNPFSNQLTVTSNQFINEIDVTNELGQVLFISAGNFGNKNTIDMSALPGGMYFITVITKTAQLVAPVVKE